MKEVVSCVHGGRAKSTHWCCPARVALAVLTQAGYSVVLEH